MDALLAHPWLAGVALLVLAALAVGARLWLDGVALARKHASLRESVRRAAEAEEARALDDLEEQSAELLRRHRREGEIADATRTSWLVPDPRDRKHS